MQVCTFKAQTPVTDFYFLNQLESSPDFSTTTIYKPEQYLKKNHYWQSSNRAVMAESISVVPSDFNLQTTQSFKKSFLLNQGEYGPDFFTTASQKRHSTYRAEPATESDFLKFQTDEGREFSNYKPATESKQIF